MKNWKVFIPIIAFIAVVSLSACGSRDKDQATDTTGVATTTTVQATTTSTTIPLPEGSFGALRQQCNDADGMAFEDIVEAMDPKPADTDMVADFAPQLYELFAADPGQNALAYVVGVAPEDSCLQVFKWFMPQVPASTSSGNRHGNGGGSGGNGGGGNTQPTVGGSDCMDGNIDPDGSGPRACEPTVTVTFPPVATNPPGPPPSVTVPNPDPTDTSPPSTAVCVIVDGVPSPACAFTS